MTDRISDVLSKLNEARRMTLIAQNGWREKHEAKVKATSVACWHRWRVENPAQVAIGREKTVRRRRGRENDSTDVTADFIRTLREQTKQCVYCHKPISYSEVTIDHVIPIKHGGLHMQHNLAGCCALCNSRKSTRLDWYPGCSAEFRH